MDQIVTNRSQLANTRDNRPDEMKAAAILGVVCIHADLPYADIFRFCVPVFIALWAFHYERGLARRGDFRPYASRRFYRLAVPYVFWTAIYLLLKSSTRRMDGHPHPHNRGWLARRKRLARAVFLHNTLSAYVAVAPDAPLGDACGNMGGRGSRFPAQHRGRLLLLPDPYCFRYRRQTFHILAPICIPWHRVRSRVPAPALVAFPRRTRITRRAGGNGASCPSRCANFAILAGERHGRVYRAHAGNRTPLAARVPPPSARRPALRGVVPIYRPE